MAALRSTGGGVSFGGAPGGSAEDYYAFAPSDDELSDCEAGDGADSIADALAATQISVAAASAERAIFTPIGGGHGLRAFKEGKLPAGVFARRGAELVRVSAESMERHAARKAGLLSALDACSVRIELSSAADWSGDAPFRFRSLVEGDVEMSAASPAPTVAMETPAPQQNASDKKMPSLFAGGGGGSEDSDSDSDGDGEGREREPDPLYDEAMDDADAKWVQSHFGAGKEESASGGSLCCPCCFVTVCMSCERHAKYTNQFRASAAVNCRLNKAEILTYMPASGGGSVPFQKRASLVTASAASSAAAQLLQADEYYPVACSDCGTTVGVYDRARQFHFFNVLPSN